MRRIDRVMIDGELVLGDGAPSLPAANVESRLPSAETPAAVDDFERPDCLTSINTLRLETGDGGIDRSVEITQVVRRYDGHALLLTA